MELKECNKCMERKTLSAFYFRKDRQQYLPKCKACTLEDRRKGWDYSEAGKASRAKYDASPKGKATRKKYEQTVKCKLYRIKKNYGLVLDNLPAICDVCGVTREHARICVDHCHSTNRARGFLCQNCNVALGYANDNEQILQGLINYLRKYQHVAA